MSDLKILIVDDEAPARAIVRNYLGSIPGIARIEECENGFEALKMVQEYKPDLMFLDIQMPKIDGFELLDVMEDKPAVIFATAYDQYAIKAFESNAVDYLLKPFSRERFLQAFNKALPKIADKSTPNPIGPLQEHLDNNNAILERVVTRLGSKITVIPVDKIHYIEAQDDYVMVYSDLGNHLKEKTMKYFEQHLPAQSFIRIHRSYIINIGQVTGSELYAKDTHLISLKCGVKLKSSAEGYKRLRGFF
jgi:two-component system LytT family response regulator